MVPAGLVHLPVLPLTPNGKVDRKALPVWNATAGVPDVARVAPRDPIEATIAECWREVLGVSAVGVEDNFFRLGGHSLLATQVVARLRERCGVPPAVIRQMRGGEVAGHEQEREEIEL
jgi:hypothetical protein